MVHAMAFAIAHNQGYWFEYTNNTFHTIPPGDMNDNSNYVRRLTFLAIRLGA